MKYPKIIVELERTQWAITPEALDGIRKAVEVGLSGEDYALFHKSEFLAKEDFSSDFEVNSQRGIIVINGPIIPRSTALSRASGIVSIEELTKRFKAFEEDESIEGIDFLIDSPGGDVVGVSDFAQIIRMSEKPTRAFVVGQAASAAYWIASAADQIISTDTGLVGSIGVVLSYNKKDDGTHEIISSQSPKKRVDAETKDGRKVLQQLVNEIADVFVSAVAVNRGVDEETVLSDFGQGGLVVANRALEIGMIDEISTINDFLFGAQERGGRSEIRTLIFKKKSFPTKASAQKWARDHDFKSSPVVDKEDTWHITQKTGNYVRTRTGKPLAPGVTPVYGIRRSQNAENQESLEEENKEIHPAKIAGERTAAMKTLAEFLAENPAAKAEVEAIKIEAFNAGKAEIRAEVSRIATLMECKAYGDKFREKALLGLKGERSLESIETLADFLDVGMEEERSQAAQEETVEQPLVAPVGDKPSANDEIKNPIDVQSYWNLFKPNRSESEVQ